MLLDQSCLYYYNCSRTQEQCLVCKLKSHTEVNKDIQVALQLDFNKMFCLAGPTIKSIRMFHAVIEGACNDELERILNQ